MTGDRKPNVRGKSSEVSYHQLEPVYAEFGAWVAERRKWCGYTQDDLAFHLGIGRTSITNIEKGRQRVLLHTALEAIEMLSHDPRPFRNLNSLFAAIADRSAKRQDPQGLGPKGESGGAGTAIAQGQVT